MSKYKLCLTLIIAMLTAASAAFAGFGPPEQIVSTKTYLSVDKLRPGDSFKVAVQATVKQGYHVGAHDKDALYPANLVLRSAKGIAFESPVYPEALRKALKISPDKKIPVYEGTFVITTEGHVTGSVKPGAVTITSSLDTQGCTDDQCYPPSVAESSVKINVTSAGSKISSANTDLFKAPASSAGASEADVIVKRLQHTNILLLPLIVYLFGLLLSCTPCVYPMMPVTVGYFSTQGGSRNKNVVLLAAVYVLGLALTYSVLGTVAATTGGMIGAAMQKPLVVAGIAVVLVGLALSMFGLYEIRPPAFIERKSSGRNGVVGALLMGMIFGIVAAPCVGPAVLGLLIYAANLGNPVIGFLLFFVLALGLGTPLFFLAAFSAKLPMPGMWMVTVKKLAGFLLLGVAAYFLLPILPGSIGRYLIPAVVVSAGIYLGFFEKSIKSGKMLAAFGKVFGASALVVAVLMLMPRHTAHLKWQPYKPNGTAIAAKAGKPVMIDFTAQWCVDCKVLENGPFSDPGVIKEAESFVRLRVDGTHSSDPGVQQAMKKYGVKGYPAVLFFDKTGKEIRSSRIAGPVDSAEMINRIKSAQ